MSNNTTPPPYKLSDCDLEARAKFMASQHQGYFTYEALREEMRYREQNKTAKSTARIAICALCASIVACGATVVSIFI